ncbi:MerR family transcriptional regulator [Planomicrobium okeanokoites]|uniref:MerR family transcriptional regulator n=1 Tax=Planomicrobium okeanokoites TaxID=244 RepID=UPI002491AF31|nr:MerR family DNA-binding transcriptional regulator [Planomicrobium okeanokoites]
MARLHSTAIKTLHYYHKINLLNPIYTDQNNGYRYYSTDQFEQQLSERLRLLIRRD